MDDTEDLTSFVSCFRLVGSIAGGTRTFLLLEGSNRIGAADDNDLILPEMGVSRRHALLEIEGTSAQIADLGSKNGTLVNGRRIDSVELNPGDEISFGPIRLSFTKVDTDDAALAFVTRRHRAAKPEASPNPGAESAAGETAAATDSGNGSFPWLELIDRFIEVRSKKSEGSQSRTLEVVARALRSKAAFLLRWSGREEAVVDAAWGGVNDVGLDRFAKLLPDLRERLSTESWLSSWDPGPPSLMLGVSRHGEEFRSLFLWDLPDPAEPSGILLRILLRVSFMGDPQAGGNRAVTRDLEETRLSFPKDHIVSRSLEMKEIYRELETASRAEVPVLLLGETGVGKEHLAEIVHLSSTRNNAPFIAINCAAIPADLLESELFGIRKGVATGVTERKGKFELATGGTIFLDEIGDMPLDLQAKLLRVLEQAQVQPVGGRPVDVDVRIVAATNADLLTLVESARFRKDLYYRLAGCVLRVPPLRARRDDIPLLVEHFMGQIAEKNGRYVRGFTLRAMSSLVEYSWPGNIRELIHEIRRLILRSRDSEVIDLPLISEHILLPSGATPDEKEAPSSLNLAEHTAALERRLIGIALVRSKGNRSKAAKLLGISRQGLAMKTERLEIGEEARKFLR